MQVPDKKLILLITAFSFISFSFYDKNVYADNLDKVRVEYADQNYEEALDLLKIEISKDPNNAESYKLLGLIYESMFEISKSIEAYKKYEEIKKKGKIATKITPLPKISSSTYPSPLKKIDKIKSLPIPSVSVTATPTISPIPSKTTVPIKPIQSIKPTTIPKLVKNIDKKIAIKINNEGWENIKINKVEKKKSIKLIPKNSLNLEEIEEIAGDGKDFLLVNCNIKYSRNIIIKNNTDQITVKDSENNVYNLFGMNTFVFKYEGDQPAKKFEAIQISDYYQLSLKEIRNNITFIFKIKENLNIKNFSIKNYKEVDISNLV